MFVITIIFLSLNLAYWLFLFSRLAFYQIPAASHAKSLEPDSLQVLVCARNEAGNIRSHLPLLLTQEGPKYDLTLIDDHSTDESSQLLEKMQKVHKKLKVVTNSQHKGKKISLHEYIPQVDKDILVFTDADCRPATKGWLALMHSAFQKEVDVVLAYAPFFKRKKGVNYFARFECVMTAIQYLSYALAGIPYMGVGRNLAYRKKLFLEAKGFSSHLDKLSGDDDLFVNEVATRKNTTIQLHPDSFVYSEAPDGWAAFFRQKRRHISSSSNYRWIHKILLALFALSHVLFYVGLLFLDLKIAALFFFVRMLILLPLVFSLFRKLNEMDLFKYFPLLDILLSIYYVLMAISPIFPNRNKW